MLYGTIPVDGWVEDLGLAINFHGCYFHGCKSHYPFDHQLNTKKMKSWGEIRHETTRIDRKIKAHPEVQQYVVMWECEWQRQRASDSSIGDLLRQTSFVPREDPRKALFGGRVEVYCLKKELSVEGGATLEHDDYQSLYPSVNLEGAYGKGHPHVYYCNFPPFDTWFGVVHCTILPSRDCFITPLPYRLPSKSIVYALCRTCAVDRNLSEPCTHTEDERALTGMWGCQEVQVAVNEAGFRLLKVHELHHFKEQIQFNRQTGILILLYTWLAC